MGKVKNTVQIEMEQIEEVNVEQPVCHIILTTAKFVLVYKFRLWFNWPAFV